MDDDSVVDLLRAAGRGGPDASAADVSRAMTAGTKIRRRRQAMQVVGSGLGVVVVLAVGFATVSTLDNDGRDTVTAAGDPTAKPEPPAKGATGLGASEQRLANLELLAAKLGSDFRVNPEGQAAGSSGNPTYPIVEVVPGSSTAKRLPAGYKMTASGGVPQTATADGEFVNDTDLETKCKPVVEKGTQISACTPVTAPGGRTVQVQEFRNEFGKLTNSAGKPLDGAATTAYFPRVDGSFVQASLNINAAGSTVTKASHVNAEDLLADFRDALVAFAADPKVGPAPGPANGRPAFESTPPTTHEQNQAYLQEALGSPTWGLYEGTVTLENNKGRYKDLPSDFFSGTASVESVTQAQFDAACGEKPGFAGCSEKTLEDGTKVHTFRWADRDAATDELRGESSVYYLRPDGAIVVATISLTSTQVTAANRDEQVNGTLTWFSYFTDGLIKAATDPRMEFGG